MGEWLRVRTPGTDLHVEFYYRPHGEHQPGRGCWTQRISATRLTDPVIETSLCINVFVDAPDWESQPSSRISNAFGNGLSFRPRVRCFARSMLAKREIR